jgi:hypothetical protein
MAAVPAPPSGETQVIHVAPGLYDTTLGESFPLSLRFDFQIVGDQGPQSTILDAGGAAIALRAWYNHTGPYEDPGPLGLVRGITLRNAVNGVDLYSSAVGLRLRLQDVRITGMSSEGVHGRAQCGWGCGAILLTLEQVEIDSCDVGLHVYNDASLTTSSMSLVDCIVRDNATLGIHQEYRYWASALLCQRTRISGNGTHGVLIDTPSIQMVSQSTLEDCLIVQNAGSGVRAASGGGSSQPQSVDLLRCTIADNGSSGLDLFDAGPGSIQVALQGSILYGNQDDVNDNPAHPSIVLAQYCDIGDGDFAGGLGNLALDPLFRAPALLDYRPRWASPCVDAGDPATPAAARDLAGMPRSIDGNLDAFGRADQGALESTPLVAVGAPHIGALVTFEQWGPAGGRAALLVSRGPRADPPLPTVFGDFYLAPGAFRNLGTRPVAPGPPALRPFAIPNDPLWIGQMLTFQMLATSSTGTPSAAWSNPATLVVLP